MRPLVFVIFWKVYHIICFSGLSHLDTPQSGELLISEIMADPVPGVGFWPECEYVELFNPTEKYLSLRDIRLRAGSRTVILPEVKLQPGAYLLLCPKGQATGFGSSATVLELGNFPILSNTGAELALTTPQGTLIEYVQYADTWYRDAKKRDGGWSLERIRPEQGSACANNWQASRSSTGGTPGLPNSAVSGDVDSPILLQAVPESEFELRVSFNEVLKNPEPAFFSLRPALPVSAAQLIEGGNEVLLLLGSPMQEGTLYTLRISANISDCAGNPAGKEQEAVTGIPALPQTGDIAINEILFEGETGVGDFIELVNTSQKLISLEGLLVRNDKKVGGVSETIIGFPWILLPGQYIALSANPAGLRQRYAPPNLARVAFCPLPTLEREEGRVVLKRGTEVVAAAAYASSWHHPLLKETRGISLERLAPEAPDIQANWHSSAFGATPGYRNSQFFSPASSGPEKFAELEHPAFSPDGDGFQDVMRVRCYPPGPGFIATIRIFDANGRPIALLANNALLAADGEYIWDGGGDAAKVGLYLVHIEGFDPYGKVFVQKLPVALAFPRR